jgi:hypothetical protein
MKAVTREATPCGVKDQLGLTRPQSGIYGAASPG